MSEHTLSTGWIKSSRCSTGACVEVAIEEDGVHVRDSKKSDGPVLDFDPAAWRDFVATIKQGELDQR